MVDAVSRSELAWRVDAVFHERYPDAPAELDAEWRQGWIYVRDAFLEEEVHRVYWFRHPEAPFQIDADDPNDEPYAVAWQAVRKEVLANAPEPEDLAP